MAENAAKRLKTADAVPASTGAGGPVAIGTHSGRFHTDEALAFHMLRLLPAYRDASLVRTRDPAVLDACHTVVDVGGVYDPAARRFDHHQRSFDTVFPGRETKLSSAGLVYMHFGRALVAQKLGRPRADAPADPAAEDEDEDVTLLWRKIYESFVEPVDANDNGIEPYDPELLAQAGLRRRFRSGGFSLAALVSRFNPRWNDPVPDDPVAAQAAEDARFRAASARIGEEFERDLDFFVTSWLPARAIVRAAYDARHRYDPAGRVLVFEGQSVPWVDHLYTLEEEEEERLGREQGEGGSAAFQKVLYVLYPEKPVPGAKWRIQAVGVSKDSYQSRKALPEPWRGTRDADLDTITGVPGGVFVHASGFTGGHKSFDGVRALAEKACAF
ncbi:metal-dependent protein hydrolase [Durotheca rogersii]|uniref:metal-dependent protein hydrolase n=1 Tax=Durotheca rogersii TaxID=419775 RepID=UPI00221E9D25|nr:metal-dependent protein hydrolase [Durotheca rogersii]KAI5867114.1 metal-dependent protein hydrolase [Durotheca rogersii]